MPLIDRRRFLQRFGVCAASLTRTPLRSAAPAPRPNFVFILMDDLGWADVGFHGSDFYETPNLDRFARESMRFEQAYAACPVCSPTRASIMTGKYPARLHLTNFIPGRSPRKFARLIPPEFEQQLPLAEQTIAETLRGAGYATASIGKWHLGGNGFGPGEQGFDFVFSTAGRHLAPNWSVNPPHQPRADEQRWARMTEEAEKFIETNQGKPFFLYLPYHLPHIPLESTPARIAKYQAKLERPEFRARAAVKAPSQNNPVYAAMIEEMDEGVGRVLRKIDAAGVAARTVVIFMSDNGGLTAREFEDRPATSNAPLREGKGHVYEGGIREPLVIRWPGVTRPGSVCDVPVSSIDFYPTLLAIAGVKDAPGHMPDGESLVPLLRRAGGLKRRALFWHYPHYSNQGGSPGAAVRSGDHKLVELYEDRRVELYDVRRDPGEKNDLAAQMPEKTAELRSILHAWLKETKAAIPTPNPAFDKNREMEGLRWIRPARN
jgi:arylsulfatase A